VKGRFRLHWTNPADVLLVDAVVDSFRDAVKWAITSEAAMPNTAYRGACRNFLDALYFGALDRNVRGRKMARSTKEQRDNEFRELARDLEGWKIPDNAVEVVHELARASLVEVKALTEYEDGKVSRLMTVVAFISAVVGAVFTIFASHYAWADPKSCLTAAWLLPFLTYLAFFIYVALVTVAVLVPMPLRHKVF
jgi:hypothetical protein